MTEAVLFLSQNPNLIVTVVALFASCGFGYLLFKNWVKRAEESEVRHAKAVEGFDGRASSLEIKMTALSMLISDHREAMGLATTSLSDEIRNSKETFYEMRRELSKEVEKIRTFTAEVHRTMVLASETGKIAIDNLNEKIGRVITLEKNVEALREEYGKVRVIGDENRADITKQGMWFKQVATALKEQKTSLIAIREQLHTKK